ncbi:MAG: UDP-N-acetylmuramate:L-alanyl-gamma-D-glutamyl-meso-diaminopimelate ligase, partial [Gammaproteobacteria bacterium]|nr:UDP-N-acetylmuramate:L-alanyl-gamma-D-glutamyl-meso-diaminopimelate ligase [Gammaproteobacteria bacterium]
ARVYPPMSTQLETAGIRLHEGYDAESLPDDIDMYIVGNAISRGNPQFEYILNHNLPYRSAPQWLYEQVLCDRWVLAVAGTHGKTTTTAMLAWILEYAGMKPGFLIGGMTQNFEQSARLGDSPFFVIEADEYDTALFDKRSKFVHYHPRTLLLNNLEFDHADIFTNLAEIQKQFHHLVRMMPANGLIIYNSDCEALNQVLDMGCWSERLAFGEAEAGSDFSVGQDNCLTDNDAAQDYSLKLQQGGTFNALNASAAVLAARHAGVSIQTSIEALRDFKGVKRRQEIIAEINGIKIIDDFAHHPTAIELTLKALREQTPGKLFAVLDIRSNTMKMGNHAGKLQQALSAADVVLLCENKDLKWDIHAIKSTEATLIDIKSDIHQMVQQLVNDCQTGDTIAVMSNGGFENIHQRLIQALQSRQ